jgi:hypothetical protein
MRVFPHAMPYAMPGELNGRRDMTWGTFTPFERSRSMLGTRTPDHHGDHRRVPSQPNEASPQAKVDAIIAPTVRPVDYLKEPARYLSYPVVTLHNGRYAFALALTRQPPAQTDWTAIDMSHRRSLRQPEFAKLSILTGATFGYQTDTSIKRKILLTLRQLFGWKHIVLPDNDIEIPNPADLERADRMLDDDNIVGIFVDGFPDNSVACQAHRHTSGQQASFIGGGAIAVKTERTRSFFPDIYNDDWFYMLDDTKCLQAAATMRKVIQYPYYPFRECYKARTEELGDVMAEGVFWLYDQDRSAYSQRLRPLLHSVRFEVAFSIWLLAAEWQKATEAHCQVEVSDALLRFNLRKLTQVEAPEPEVFDFTATKRQNLQCSGICKPFRRDFQSLEPAELCTMLRHMGFRGASSRHYDEAEQDQRLAFLRALIGIRSQQKRGAEARSSLSSLRSDPLSRQTSTRDRMMASSRSLRGPTFPAASWPTRGTAIAA